jgi:hypothetical protein
MTSAHRHLLATAGRVSLAEVVPLIAAGRSM